MAMKLALVSASVVFAAENESVRELQKDGSYCSQKKIQVVAQIAYMFPLLAQVLETMGDDSHTEDLQFAFVQAYEHCDLGQFEHHFPFWGSGVSGSDFVTSLSPRRQLQVQEDTMTQVRQLDLPTCIADIEAIIPDVEKVIADFKAGNYTQALTDALALEPEIQKAATDCLSRRLLEESPAIYV
jgi:hypothetical protein